MSSIENQDNTDNNEELGPGSASDKIDKEGTAKNIVNKAGKTAGTAVKKVLKKPHVVAFIAANIIPIIIAISVILVIIVLIGNLAFFLTMPGMVLEKVKKVAMGIWANWTGWFTGDQTTAGITEDDIVGLGQYLQDMGYDIESYGFGIPEYEEKEENESLTSRTLKKIDTSADNKNYLKAYLATSENTYALAEVSIYGGLMQVASGIKRFVTLGQSEYETSEDISTGMINILNTNSALGNVFGQFKPVDYVKIDRDNEKMIVYTNAIYSPILDFFNTNSGKIQWGSVFSYDLSTWTSKYGRPLELMLALHLSTMMPDLAYRVATDKSINTKVNIVLQDINVTYDTSAKSPNGSNISSQQIIDAFIDYGLSAEKLDYEYKETVQNSTQSGNSTNTTGSTTTEITHQGSINFYDEIKKNVGNDPEKRSKLFLNIMEQAKNPLVQANLWGINIRNAIEDSNSIIRSFLHSVGGLFSKVTFWTNKDDKYYVYITRGSGQVPGLDGISYDDLFELAEITARGMGAGIDGVKWPYIESVTNHWFYEDIDFSKGVYKKAKSATKKIKYAPADDSSALVKDNIEVELNATLTADEGIVYQVCEPEAYGPNQAIIDIFKDKYYRYDGTIRTANAIENAKGYETLYGGGWITTRHSIPELVKLFFNTEMPEVEKEEVSFEDNKPNALAAFNMLENMHTEEADFVYRNLKDLVKDLGYFTEEELTTDLENAMLWLIKTDDKNEKFEITKDANEFGMTIKNVKGREIIAPENAKVSILDDGTVELAFTQMSDDTVKLLEYIYGDYYKNINKDILVGMTMKIKGIDTNTVVTGDVLRGSKIGDATEDLQVVMVDIDKSLIEDIEIYMRQENNFKYEEGMKKKMNNSSNDVGIDIGRARTY